MLDIQLAGLKNITLVGRFGNASEAFVDDWIPLINVPPPNLRVSIKVRIVLNVFNSSRLLLLVVIISSQC